LARGTIYLPSDRLAWPRLVLAALGVSSATPRAASTLWWDFDVGDGRNHGDVLRFAQAAYIASRLPAGI